MYFFRMYTHTKFIETWQSGSQGFKPKCTGVSHSAQESQSILILQGRRFKAQGDKGKQREGNPETKKKLKTSRVF